MREHCVDIPVGTEQTRGWLRMPSEPGRFPMVVHCPGWMSTKDARHYRNYHRFFIEHGFASLVFDYRVLSSSAAAPVIDPFEMVADADAAIAFARDCADVEPDRVVLLGTGGVGAGVALMAALSGPVVAVAMVSPFASGSSWLASMRSSDEYQELLERVSADRHARTRGEPPVTVPPVGGITLPPSERAQIGFKTDIRRDLPDMVALETVERLLRFCPLDHVATLAPRSLLLVACRGDSAVPYDDARRLYDAAGEPKQLVTLDGTSSYRMHQTHWRQIATAVVRLVASTTGHRKEDQKAP